MTDSASGRTWFSSGDWTHDGVFINPDDMNGLVEHEVAALEARVAAAEAERDASTRERTRLVVELADEKIDHSEMEDALKALEKRVAAAEVERMWMRAYGQEVRRADENYASYERVKELYGVCSDKLAAAEVQAAALAEALENTLDTMKHQAPDLYEAMDDARAALRRVREAPGGAVREALNEARERVRPLIEREERGERGPAPAAGAPQHCEMCSIADPPHECEGIVVPEGAVGALERAVHQVLERSRVHPGGSITVEPQTHDGALAFWESIKGLHAALAPPARPSAEVIK